MYESVCAQLEAKLTVGVSSLITLLLVDKRSTVLG